MQTTQLGQERRLRQVRLRRHRPAAQGRGHLRLGLREGRRQGAERRRPTATRSPTTSTSTTGSPSTTAGCRTTRRRPGRWPSCAGHNTANWRAAGTRFRETVLAKLETIVTMTPDMSVTAMYSDYVLPVAQHYERQDFVMEGRTPYIQVLDRAVPPLGESEDDWQIMARLAKAISEKARARQLPPVKDVIYGKPDRARLQPGARAVHAERQDHQHPGHRPVPHRQFARASRRSPSRSWRRRASCAATIPTTCSSARTRPTATRCWPARATRSPTPRSPAGSSSTSTTTGS